MERRRAWYQAQRIFQPAARRFPGRRLSSVQPVPRSRAAGRPQRAFLELAPELRRVLCLEHCARHGPLFRRRRSDRRQCRLFFDTFHLACGFGRPAQCRRHGFSHLRTRLPGKFAGATCSRRRGHWRGFRFKRGLRGDRLLMISIKNRIRILIVQIENRSRSRDCRNRRYWLARRNRWSSGLASRGWCDRCCRPRRP